MRLTEASYSVNALNADRQFTTTEARIRNEAGRGVGDYLAGVWAGVPFALVAGVVAISFGVLARSLGWGVVAPIVFSVITFSASAQFAVAAVLGAGVGCSRRLPLACS